MVYSNNGAVELVKTSIGIIYKHDHEPARTQARKLQEWLEQRGIQAFTEEMNAKGSSYACCEEDSAIPKTVRWVVVLGGDGTILAAARRNHAKVLTGDPHFKDLKDAIFIE